MGTIARMISMLLLVSFSVACDSGGPGKGPDAVNLQLKWVHQAQFAGLYMAKEKGYYAQENIKVNFLEGGAEVDIADRLAAGKADFAVLAPEFIFLKRAKGAPLTAIASIYRRSAVVFAALADSGIVRPSDFLGKTVAAGDPTGSQMDFALQFSAMMKKLGLDISKVRVLPYDPAYTAFYKGEVQVTPCYSTGGLIKIRQQGVKLNLIWPGDYGIQFYSDSLATTERLIKERPELVTRFLLASIKGWREAMENYPEALAVTLKYARVKDRGLQAEMLEALLPLVHTGEDQIGWMRDEVWWGMYRVLLEQKLLATPLDLGRVYNLRFLNEIYGGRPK